MAITVRFAESNISQTEMKSRLEQAILQLSQAEILEAPSVEVLFPGDTDPYYSCIFIITGCGREIEVARQLAALPNVAAAHVAPSRTTM